MKKDFKDWPGPVCSTALPLPELVPAVVNDVMTHASAVDDLLFVGVER